MIEALGYIGLEVADLAAWRAFATQILGLQAVDRADGGIDLRLDDHAWRLRLSEGPRDDLAYLGWEVRDAFALAALAATLEAQGVALETGDAARCADRRVAGLIAFADPDGNAHEAFFGPLQRTDARFVSPLGVAFRTGRQGLGHIVLAARDPAAMSRFFADTLGFRLSDIVATEVVPGRPLRIEFLRCNARHHSLALAAVPVPRRIVHLMLEVGDIDDVGRALDRCRGANVHLSFTLGRHSNDAMLSFYALTPSGFDIEYGWGGIEVDDARWHVVTHDAISAWGHVYQRPPRPAA